jgi:hypothetical protein
VGQAVSELIAAGASMKSLLDGIFVVYNVLILAYGVGLLLPTSRSRLGFLGGLTLVLVGAHRRGPDDARDAVPGPRLA